MPTSDPAKQLARELADLRREVRSASRGSQARFRSLEGGSIPIYDSNGVLQGQVGVLPDGTTGFQTMDGPKPPAPSAPIVFPTVGGLEIRWDGTFWENVAAPGDFQAIEVHAAPYSVYTPDSSTLRAALIGTSSYFLQLPEQPWTIIFVTRSTSGVLSDPSVPATETPEHLPTDVEINDARQVAANAALSAAEANDKALEAAGIAANKGKVYYGTTAPAADPNGLWIDTTGGANTPKRHNGTDWVAVTDKAATDAATAAANAATAAGTALTAAQAAQQKADSAFTKAETAQTSADGKNKVFYRASDNPPPAPLIENDLWFQTDKGNTPFKYVAASTSWVAATFGDGAISGLNVGKLTAGSIATGQKIVAGPTGGTHAEMSDDGFRVFKADPLDNIPDEVVRMGTSTDDFIGIVDRTGNLLASIDSTGDGNFQSVNTEALRIGGASISTILGAASGSGAAGGLGPPGARNYYGFAAQGGNLGPITSTSGAVGLIEMAVTVEAGRAYWVVPEVSWSRSDPGGELRVIVWDGGVNSPTINSGAIYIRQFSHATAGYDAVATSPGLWVPPVGGVHRLLLGVSGAGPGNMTVSTLFAPTITIIDLGPSAGINASVNRGGGNVQNQPPPPPPPPPTQQYYVDLGPSGRRSWGGGGNVIGNGTDVYQGYESYNGNTRGMFWFEPPAITGNVDRVDVYLYYRHWWFNSGGRILMGLTDQRDVFTDHTFKPMWEPNVTVSKPGSATVTLPGDWFPYFRGTNNTGFSGRATAIRIGPGPGSNQTYYGVATDARLRIWYTQ